MCEGVYFAGLEVAALYLADRVPVLPVLIAEVYPAVYALIAALFRLGDARDEADLIRIYGITGLPQRAKPFLASGNREFNACVDVATLYRLLYLKQSRVHSWRLVEVLHLS